METVFLFKKLNQLEHRQMENQDDERSISQENQTSSLY